MNIVVNRDLPRPGSPQNLPERQTLQRRKIRSRFDSAFLAIDGTSETDADRRNLARVGMPDKLFNGVYECLLKFVGFFRRFVFDTFDDTEPIIKQVYTRLGSADVDTDPAIFRHGFSVTHPVAGRPEQWLWVAIS